MIETLRAKKTKRLAKWCRRDLCRRIAWMLGWSGAVIVLGAMVAGNVDQVSARDKTAARISVLIATGREVRITVSGLEWRLCGLPDSKQKV